MAEVKTAAEAKPKAATKPAAEKKPAKTGEKKVYHITKRNDDNKWAVTLEKGEKALKLFNTKAQAEEYVKGLLANNDAARVVSHKKDGKIQKSR